MRAAPDPASAPASGGPARPPLPALWVMSVALLSVAINLRVTMTSIPPLIDAISADLGLNGSMAGLLTALPVLCMGLFAPLASRVSHLLGAPAAVLCSIVAILLGTLGRGFGNHVVLLYLGTLVAGIGIAIAGPLLPQLVKTFFPPGRIGLATGLYMGGMQGGATVASALAVPLADLFGSWQASLGSWAVLAVLGLLVWVPFTLRANPRRLRGEIVRAPLPWSNLVAWTVAVYLALQSWCFYSSVAWLAPTYVEHGWSRASAGFLFALFTTAQIISGLLGPVLSDRVIDMRPLLLISAALSSIGCFGVYLAPLAAPWVWAFVNGFGQGSAFSLGLVLLVRYARTPAASTRLSGVGFLVSYLVAAFGPLTMGALRDRVGTLTLTWLILGLIGVVQGLLATRLRPDLPRIA